MTIPNEIKDLENQKFVDTGNKPSVRIIAVDASGNVITSWSVGQSGTWRVRVTDDDVNDAYVGQSGRWGTPLGSYTQQGLNVNTRFHFLYDADHPDSSGDNNWYAGTMDDNGNFNVNFSSLGGVLVAKSSGNLSTGVQRVCVATNDVNISAIKTAVEVIDNFISGSRGLVTEDNSSSIKTAIEALLTARTGIVTDVTVDKATTDGDIIAAPSSGSQILVHHLSYSNHGNEDVTFKIRKGSGGSVIRNVTLAKNGGNVEANLKKPVGVGDAVSLYYDYISGSSADISISVHYEVV